MTFDIARKIVKFQNGQYGIRRWTWYGYQFLGLELRHGEDFWWGAIPEYVAQYAAGSESDVREHLSGYLAPRPPISHTAPGYDKGTPV